MEEGIKPLHMSLDKKRPESHQKAELVQNWAQKNLHNQLSFHVITEFELFLILCSDF